MEIGKGVLRRAAELSRPRHSSWIPRAVAYAVNNDFVIGDFIEDEIWIRRSRETSIVGSSVRAPMRG
jgi:hypothetical protein